MNKFEILSLALEYIEDDLCDADAVKCAEVCGYSLSNLQKMFSCVFHRDKRVHSPQTADKSGA